VGGQVLLGPRTYELVREVVDVRGTLEVALKGVDTPLTIHDVCAVRGRYAVSLPDAVVDAPVAIDPPVTATCYAIDGKRVAEAGVAATLTAVSATCVEATMDGTVVARETLKLVVAAPDAPAEAYAKVVAVRPGGEVTLAFTSVSPAMRRFLDARGVAPAGSPVSDPA
jgi:hypothetical protein